MTFSQARHPTKTREINGTETPHTMGGWAIYEGLAPGLIYFYDDAPFILAFIMFAFVHLISFVLPFAFYMGFWDDWQIPFTEDETYRAPHWLLNATMWYLMVVANSELYPGFHLLTDGKGNILTDIFVFSYMHIATLGYTYFNISRLFDDTRTEKFWKRK